MPDKPSKRSEARPRRHPIEWIRPIAVAVALIAIWLGGVGLRGRAFQSLEYQADAPFFLESAQHFRNVRLVAEGKGIPRLDVDLQYPDGLLTRSHTLLGETLLGGIYRLFNIDGLVRFTRTHALFGHYLSDLIGDFLPRGEERLTEYVRLSVRYSMGLLIFPIYLLAAHLARNRLSGFLAACLYATAYAAVERSTGWEFFHEHTAFPFLGFHLYFQVLALERGRWRDIAASAVFLLLSLLCWKIIQFYLLTLIGFYILVFLAGRWRDIERRIVIVHAGVLVAAAFLFENHLRYGRFWFAKPMLACYALLLAEWLLRRWNKSGMLWRVAAFSGLIITLLTMVSIMGRAFPETSLLNPAAERYGHVWETLFAILRYGGHKPADPSLLPFDARHYWGAPNTPPSWIRALSLYGLILPMAVISLIVIFRRYYYKTPPGGPGAETPEWKGPLESRGLWLILYCFVAFLIFYALFYKMTSFLSLYTAILAGLGLPMLVRPEQQPLFTSFRQAERRFLFLALFGLLLLACIVQSLAPRQFFLTHALARLGFKPSLEKEYQNVLAPSCMPQLLEWIRTKTQPGDAFLTEFVLAPTILVYLDRPVNLNPFFESDMRLRFRDFSETLFKSEEDFYNLCARWKTRYFVYNAHILLRDDPYMSYRYIANKMGWSEDWAAYRFHFRPDQLKHFSLVHQDDCFRVYRVLEPGEIKQDAEGRMPPVFNETDFRRMFQSGQDKPLIQESGSEK